MSTWPRTIADDVVLRRVTTDDAEAMAQARRRNREHLAPWEPRQPESFFTTEGQRARLEAREIDEAAGRAVSGVLVRGGSTIVGSVNLNNVVRGALCGADIGYWVDGACTGRGLATAAVAAALDEARSLGLHRVQAGTLVHNVASQTVLRRSGFERFGLAPQYLYIDGAWRDHVLFQHLLGDDPPS